MTLSFDLEAFWNARVGNIRHIEGPIYLRPLKTASFPSLRTSCSAKGSVSFRVGVEPASLRGSLYELNM